MNREQAIEIARKHAKANPQSYYAEPFQPHEWVISAILEASGGESCDVPPIGWRCTRGKGHEGPCAAIPADGVLP